MAKAREKPIAVYTAMGADILVAAGKLLAAAVTGSSAMLSEGIHSIADAANQSLLLLGVHLGNRKADARHPFGHGKELYFWSLLVAIVLFGLGGGVAVRQGIAAFSRDGPVERSFWSYAALAVAAVFDGSAFFVSYRKLRGRQEPGETLWHALRDSKDPALFVPFLEDAAALAGIAVAFAGVFLSTRLNSPVFDGAASIVIGAILGAVAVLLAYETRGLIVGESIESDRVRNICESIEQDPAVERVTRPLTMYIGPDNALLAVDLQFRDDLSEGDIAEAVDRLERHIRTRYPTISRIFIEARALDDAA